MDRISGVSEITFPEFVVALGFGVSRFIHMSVFKTDPIPHPFTTKRNSATGKKKKKRLANGQKDIQQILYVVNFS